MRYALIPGIQKEVSRLVIGTVLIEPAVWETFVERGGTCFDAAYHYGEEAERALGAFVERHGLRERLVIVGKGAHTPTCAPEHVTPQLLASLDHLRTDYLDLYLLHRDDLVVPVSEWAHTLHEHVAAGRMRAIGASNWTIERYEAFNEYAARNRLTGFTVLSNQLSLAEVLEPVWTGCLSVFDAASRAWLERTRTPLLAWSAQARGFFAGRPEDGEMRASWLSEANLRRRRHAEELAVRLGVPTVAAALAWVLCQPFPTFAVVGPRSLEELEACLAALDVELDEHEHGCLES